MEVFKWLCLAKGGFRPKSYECHPHAGIIDWAKDNIETTYKSEVGRFYLNSYMLIVSENRNFNPPVAEQ